MTHGFIQQHLNIIFKLFVTTGCILSLEEVCNGVFGPHFPASQPDMTTFGEMVELAAKECKYWEVTPSLLLGALLSAPKTISQPLGNNL
jgi:hypothetical protein